MPSSCTNASSMTTSAAVWLPPLSCLKNHLSCRFFYNDEVACQARRSRSHCRYVYAGVGVEKLGGGSCPNRGPSAVFSSTFSHCLAMVSSHATAPLPTVDLPSPSLAQNRQYRETVTCSPMQPEQEIVTVVKVRIICTRSGRIVILPHRQSDNELKTIADAE